MNVPVQNIRVWLSRNENRHFISQIALLGSVSIFCIYDSFSCFVCFFCCLSSSFTVSVEFSRVYASKFSYGSVPCFLAAVHFLVSCVSLSCPLWMFLSHVRVSLRVSSPVPMSLSCFIPCLPRLSRASTCVLPNPSCLSPSVSPSRSLCPSLRVPVVLLFHLLFLFLPQSQCRAMSLVIVCSCCFWQPRVLCSACSVLLRSV